MKGVRHSLAHRAARAAARAAGVGRFEGDPCDVCGSSTRTVREGRCIACRRQQNIDYAKPIKAALRAPRRRAGPNLGPGITIAMVMARR